VAEEYMQHGFMNAKVVAGGYDAWRKAGLPTTG
jgi:rhodanese-related sulfurtransferase